MAIVYSFGLNTAFLQFYLIEPDKKKRDKYFSTAFLATFALALVLSLITYSFKASIAKLLFENEEWERIYLFLDQAENLFRESEDEKGLIEVARIRQN